MRTRLSVLILVLSAALYTGRGLPRPRLPGGPLVIGMAGSRPPETCLTSASISRKDPRLLR